MEDQRTGQSSVRRMLVENVQTPEKHANKRTVTAKEVARKLKSFHHFRYLWGEKGRYYLPPATHISWAYIAQILSGEKRLLKLDQVGHQVEIPKLRGFRVEDLWQEYHNKNYFEEYFPDATNMLRIPRNYFYNVVSEGAQSGAAGRVQTGDERAEHRKQEKGEAAEGARHSDHGRGEQTPVRVR